MSFDVIADELLVLVLRNLPCIVRLRECARVCRRWHRVSLDRTVFGRTSCVDPLSLVTERLGDCVDSLSVFMVVNAGGRPLPRSSLLLRAAAREGHTECVRYARARGQDWGNDACTAAARGGHLPTLRWLIEAGCPHLVCLYRSGEPVGFDLVGSDPGVHYHVPRGRLKSLMERAIAGGSVDCVRWLVGRGMVLGWRACAIAAKHGHLDMLRYARENGARWDDVVCHAAVLHNRVDVLIYAHGEGLSIEHCPWSNAAREGWIALLAFAVAHGCEPKQSCMLAAIGRGHKGISVAQWLVDRGYEWDPTDCVAIARTKSTSLLDFARAQGCPWDAGTCKAAALVGCLAILQQAHEGGCPWNWHACMAASTARACRHYLPLHRDCGEHGACHLVHP